LATYAIGDIQGCYDSLAALLEKISFSTNDRLWIAGDLVNRGPKSLKTLQYLMQISDQVDFVLGNHDLHLLALAHGHGKVKRSDTLDDILSSAKANSLIEWLSTGLLVSQKPEFNALMSHAGIPPMWSAKQARELAQEVETAIQGPSAHRFFKHMYGNEPNVWSPDLEGNDRLRTITNYFTRMRFLDAQFALDLTSKGELSTAPHGFKPWFDYHNPHLNETLYFGHWAALEGYTGTTKHQALDTGCVWGNTLTALRLEDKKRFSVPAQDAF